MHHIWWMVFSYLSQRRVGEPCFGHHALASTWRSSAFINAVSTLPAYHGQGYGSVVMRQLASDINVRHL